MAAGLGIAILPAPRAGMPEAASGPVLYREIDDVRATREICLSWAADRRLPPAAELFRLARDLQGQCRTPSGPGRVRSAAGASVRVGPPVDRPDPDGGQGVHGPLVVERHALLAALAEPDVAEVLQHRRQRRRGQDRVDARAVSVALGPAYLSRDPADTASSRSSSHRSRKRPSTIAAWKMPISSPRRRA